MQNGDIPEAVTILLIAADRRDSSLASASAAMIASDSRSLAPLVRLSPPSGAREGAGRPGAQLAPKGASREGRFVPLAAVVPTAPTH